jgi:O-antigen/teichoic acid export membrane protein
MEELLEPPAVMEEPALAAPFDESPQGSPPPVEIGALESTALRATFWTVISYGAAQGLRLVNSLVLTRLLVPEAFGQMTLVTTLIVGITLLSDIGLGPSIIQSARGDDDHFLNTAWTLQVVRGLALWVVALVLTWPAAIFYHDRSLLAVMPVLALSMLVTGFNSTNLLTLSRHMGVRRLFAIDFSTQIVALVVTVTWAYYYPSVWALVGGNMVSNLYRLALSHSSRLVPGIRNRILWDRDSVKDILHFGKWIFLGTAFYFFASQADRLILGKCVTMSVLGVYGIAFALSDIPRSVIGAFSQKVGYPFIAKIIHLPMAEFRAQYLRYRMYALLTGAVLLTMMVVWGDVLVLKLYKPSYAAAAWMVPVLAAGLWHTLLYQTTSPVLFSLGKSKYNAVGNAVYCVTMVTAIPIAFAYFGLLGAVIAVAAGDLPLYLVFLFGAQREGVRPLKQDLQLTAVFLAILGTAFALRHVIR